MKWAHLPIEGGLYDQHPDLLDKFRYIFSKRNEYQADEDRKRKVEADSKRNRSARKSGGASRTR